MKPFSCKFFHQYLATFSALLNMISFGAHEAWTSVYVPRLLNRDTSKMSISSREELFITLSFFFGTVIGCSLSLSVTNNFGRKSTILLSAIPFFVSFISLIFADSVFAVCVIRTISGIASGLTLVVLPLYIGEIADPTIRGFLGSFIYIFNVIGFLFMNIIGTFLSTKTTCIICSLISIVHFMTFAWMPESPYFLIMKNNFDGARISLKKLKNQENVSEEFERLKNAVEIETKNRGKFLELFKIKTNKKAMFIQFILLNSKQLTGDDLFDVFAQTIFGQILRYISSETIVIIYYFVKLFMTLLSSMLIDRLGRRILLFFSLLSSGITLLSLGIYLYFKLHTDYSVGRFEYLASTLLILFAAFYSFLAPIPSIMVGELFPMNVKVLASLICEIYFCLLSILVIWFFEATTRSYGTDVSFFTFAASCFLHLILIYYFVPETKGETLEEIQRKLLSKNMK